MPVFSHLEVIFFRTLRAIRGLRRKCVQGAHSHAINFQRTIPAPAPIDYYPEQLGGESFLSR